MRRTSSSRQPGSVLIRAALCVLLASSTAGMYVHPLSLLDLSTLTVCVCQGATRAVSFWHRKWHACTVGCGIPCVLWCSGKRGRPLVIVARHGRTGWTPLRPQLIQHAYTPPHSSHFPPSRPRALGSYSFPPPHSQTHSLCHPTTLLLHRLLLPSLETPTATTTLLLLHHQHQHATCLCGRLRSRGLRKGQRWLERRQFPPPKNSRCPPGLLPLAALD